MKYVVDIDFKGTLSFLVEAEDQGTAQIKAEDLLRKCIDEDTIGVAVNEFETQGIRRVIE